MNQRAAPIPPLVPMLSGGAPPPEAVRMLYRSTLHSLATGYFEAYQENSLLKGSVSSLDDFCFWHSFKEELKLYRMVYFIPPLRGPDRL